MTNVTGHLPTRQEHDDIMTTNDQATRRGALGALALILAIVACFVNPTVSHAATGTMHGSSYRMVCFGGRGHSPYAPRGWNYDRGVWTDELGRVMAYRQYEETPVCVIPARVIGHAHPDMSVVSALTVGKPSARFIRTVCAEGEVIYYPWFNVSTCETLTFEAY